MMMCTFEHLFFFFLSNRGELGMEIKYFKTLLKNFQGILKFLVKYYQQFLHCWLIFKFWRLELCFAIDFF